MSKHAIDDLVSGAYSKAIENLITIINRSIGHEVLTKKDWDKAENIAKRLNVMFDENGEIAQKE